MSRVRTDPLVAALTHPTRQGAYQALSQRDEMSTVQLQEALDVDRYNLYHHLKRLVKVGLIENHRDAGRARWWRVVKQVPLPSMGGSEPSSLASPLDELTKLTHVHAIDLVDSRGQVGAKQLVQKLAQEYNIPLDLPWNFLPGKIILVGTKKNDDE